MIPVACSKCLSRFNAPDGSAGKSGKCPNCGEPITVPISQRSGPGGPAQGAAQPLSQGPAAAVVTTTGQTSPAAGVLGGTPGTTVVVQVQVQGQAANTIGPANKSLLVVLLLAFLTAGFQYLYLGQIGKGATILILNWVIFGLLDVFTLGFFLPIHVAIALIIGPILLIDAIVVTLRIRKGPIHPWRFF